MLWAVMENTPRKQGAKEFVLGFSVPLGCSLAFGRQSRISMSGSTWLSRAAQQEGQADQV